MPRRSWSWRRRRRQTYVWGAGRELGWLPSPCHPPGGTAAFPCGLGDRGRSPPGLVHSWQSGAGSDPGKDKSWGGHPQPRRGQRDGGRDQSQLLHGQGCPGMEPDGQPGSAKQGTGTPRWGQSHSGSEQPLERGMWGPHVSPGSSVSLLLSEELSSRGGGSPLVPGQAEAAWAA